MEPSERLERIRRSRRIEEIAEQTRWIEREGIDERKKPVLDREVADAVWRAVREDVGALQTWGFVNPDLAIRQHGVRLKYYRSVEKTMGRIVGDASVAKDAARQARSIYAGEIVGIAASTSDTSDRAVIRMRTAREIVKRENPNIYSSHAMVKIFALNQRVPNAQQVIATGWESRIFGVGRRIMEEIDRSGEPKIIRTLDRAKELTRRHFKGLVESVGNLDAEATSREAITAGQRIRHEADLLTAVMEPSVVLSLKQQALNELYRKLLAEAKRLEGMGNVRGAERLMHAARKVAGWNVVGAGSRKGKKS